MSYFSGFPVVGYKFGNLSTETAFQDLSSYVEIIDTIKDNVNFYNLYQITEGERPDVLSTKLYGTPSLYWTFYLMNDNIREQGWPLSMQEVIQFANDNYTNTVLTTTSSLNGIFKPGQTVYGNQGGAEGIIKSRRLDFGQLIVETSGGFLPTELVTSVVGQTSQSINLIRATTQSNSIHHWEDSDGITVDVDPSVGSSDFFIPITQYERLVAENDKLKSIRIIKPTAIAQVRSLFKEALSK